MKNKFKKYMSLTFSLMFIFSVLTSYASAADAEKLISSEKIIVSEWDEYTRITSMSDKELIKSGYTAEEIIEIRSFDYEKAIRDRAKLDYETLKRYGYTDSEIIELRQVASMKTIPEDVMRSISEATMTSELRYAGNGSYQDAGKTMYYIDLKFSWNWNRIPLFHLVDMVAVGFDSSTTKDFMYCVRSDRKVYANLISVNSSYSNISQVVEWEYSTSEANNISAEFAVALEDGNGNLTHFASSGYGLFRLTNRSNQAMLFVDACYGHSILDIDPDFSMSTSGSSIGINFGFGIDEQHCTGWFFEDYTVSTSYVYHGVVRGKNNTGGAAP